MDWLLGFEVAEGNSRQGLGRQGAASCRMADTRVSVLHKCQIRLRGSRTSTMSHGINLRPDQKEIWFVDGVYGYVYAFDVTSLPPKHVADMPIFKDPDQTPKPGWVSFSLDGSMHTLTAVSFTTRTPRKSPREFRRVKR